jgi:hydroxymethylbilane synthase
MAVEGRADDAFVRGLLAELEDPATRIAVTAERALLERLQGGCQVPIAAHAVVQEDRVVITGLIASTDGRQVVREAVQGVATHAAALGTRLAERLLAQGGEPILKEIYGRA